ncbi:MAG: phosphotransferase [Nanoarchaeota archaeon]|nr:phosphotransferase [Nanoarchaeota archaeon]
MDRLERRVLEFVVRHPKGTAALGLVVAFGQMAMSGNTIRDLKPSNLNFAGACALYTGLTLAKDYWLGARETIEPRTDSLFQKVVTGIRNNPKIPAVAAGLALGAQSLVLHPGDFPKAAFNYIVAFGLGYWLCETSKQEELARRAEKKSRKGLAGKLLDIYDTILEHPKIPAIGVAAYWAFKYLRFDLPPKDQFTHLTAWCFVTGLASGAAYLAGLGIGGLLHTSSLNKFRLMYKRWRAERKEDYEKASEIQEEFLETSMPIQKRLKEMARLAKFYALKEDLPSAMNIANEMLVVPKSYPEVSSALDVLTNMLSPAIIEKERMVNAAKSSFKEGGVELALHYFMQKDYEKSIQVWEDIIPRSFNPDYTRLLKTQNLRLMEMHEEANAAITRFISKNRQYFKTRFGSLFKIITFDPESGLGNLIAIKTGVQKNRYVTECLKREHNVSRYINLCLRNHSPVPMGLYDTKEATFYMMSHLRGEPLGELIDEDKTVLRQLMRDFATFQKRTTESRGKLKTLKIEIPNLSIQNWGYDKILKRLRTDEHGLLDALKEIEVHMQHLTMLFSNGDLHRDNVIRGRNYCFLDFERSCFTWPAFVLFGIYEDPRNGINGKMKTTLINDYLEELNCDRTIISRDQFDLAYDLIYSPRMLATVAMFHDYAKRDSRFLDSAKSALRKLDEHSPISSPAKEFKDAATDFVYRTGCLEQYIAS